MTAWNLIFVCVGVSGEGGGESGGQRSKAGNKEAAKQSRQVAAPCSKVALMLS